MEKERVFTEDHSCSNGHEMGYFSLRSACQSDMSVMSVSFLNHCQGVIGIQEALSVFVCV